MWLIVLNIPCNTFIPGHPRIWKNKWLTYTLMGIPPSSSSSFSAILSSFLHRHTAQPVINLVRDKNAIKPACVMWRERRKEDAARIGRWCIYIIQRAMRLLTYLYSWLMLCKTHHSMNIYIQEFTRENCSPKTNNNYGMVHCSGRNRIEKRESIAWQWFYELKNLDKVSRIFLMSTVLFEIGPFSSQYAVRMLMKQWKLILAKTLMRKFQCHCDHQNIAELQFHMTGRSSES